MAISNDRMDRIVERSTELEQELATASDPKEIVRLSQAFAALAMPVRRIREYRAIGEQIDAAREMLADPEMREMAAEEVEALRARVAEAEVNLREALLPADALDSRPAVLEVRAGTGGQEAALFVADLVRMYERYAQSRGWKFDIVAERATELGGSRETVATVRGKEVFARLRHEAGVHRVQRVPDTESSGRIHTSAASVAVLPEPDEVEADIRPEDVRVDTMRASGAGGQHVNVTDSAVRVTHVPTGIVVVSSEKSQHRNRAKAMEVLRARLFARQLAEADAERTRDRRGQIGTGDRSERIRTYNFPQDRLTDHRIGLTLHDLPAILAGALDGLLDALMQADRAARLAALDE